jgi:hypothetical protein
MKKSKKYGVNAAVIIGCIWMIADAVKQHDEIASNSIQKFDWMRLMKAALKGAAIGGALGFGVGSFVDYKNSKEKPLDTDAYLNDLADRIRLDKTSSRFGALDSKAEVLIHLLRQEFGLKLVSNPVRLGSTERETALNEKFDIDIALKFKSASFKSTEAMYFSVLDFLERQVGKHSITGIRDQKKSIGVLFDINGQEERIDVVPFKSTRGKRTSGYLFVNEQGILSNNYSFTKTDINVLNRVRLSETQKKIVIILKDWKNRNDLPIKSTLLERLVSNAYRCNLSIPRGLTKKVIMVLKHIANNLDRSIIRGLENTNNILTDIPEEDKDRIIQACKQAIDDYSYQPNDILNSF